MPVDRTVPLVECSLIDRWSAHPVIADVCAAYFYSNDNVSLQMWSKIIRSYVQSMSDNVRQKRVAIVFCAPKVVCMWSPIVTCTLWLHFSVDMVQMSIIKSYRHRVCASLNSSILILPGDSVGL
jgi:hypothetical protein